jgi:FkbM family methyltransferase
MLVPDIYKKLLKTYVPDKLLNKIKRLHYYRMLKSFNVESEPDLLIVKEFVAEGDLVIDIGANIGVYTMYLSNFVGIKGKVLSIEPIPLTYSFLLYNIDRLRLLNIEPHNVGIADKEFTSKMYIPTGGSGENYFRAKRLDANDKISDMNLSGIEVKFVSLDKLLVSLNQSISFIKIDVEGFEMSVLKGAIKTLENYKLSLLVEIDGDPSDSGSNAYNVLNFLQALNYSPYIFVDKKLKKWNDGDISVNYFFFSDYHTKLLTDKSIIN